MTRVVDPGYEDLGYARLDTDRASRTGDPEVVYGSGKTPAQIVELLGRLHASHPDRAVLATRLSDDATAAIREELPAATIEDVAHAAWLGPLPEPRSRAGGSASCRPAPPTPRWPARQP
jgi:NCAIR mutase (PurE)-related protein